MMMNFKKNQNNAVCSMDCKNCPNGASQPNPMDDSMFEKSIAMLHNWVMLEAIREDADALTSAFEEFTNRKLKTKEKPSVLEQLNKLKELVAAILPDKVRHKSQERDL